MCVCVCVCVCVCAKGRRTGLVVILLHGHSTLPSRDPRDAERKLAQVDRRGSPKRCPRRQSHFAGAE